jgi:malate synthase A
MANPFLSNYLRLVVQTCMRRGAPATGGMAARILPSGPDAAKLEVDKVVSAKRKEVEWGVQGFLLYDFGLVAPCRALWAATAPGRPEPNLVTAEHLLSLPPGGITRAGLRHNVLVGVLFIAGWLEGRGVVEVRGSVEDSATAEISRSQVWQWIRHRAALEEDGTVVTAGLVRGLVAEVVVGEPADEEAGQIFMEVVTARLFPEFLTTLLRWE